jgi:hypothetical protein
VLNADEAMSQTKEVVEKCIAELNALSSEESFVTRIGTCGAVETGKQQLKATLNSQRCGVRSDSAANSLAMVV